MFKKLTNRKACLKMLAVADKLPKKFKIGQQVWRVTKHYGENEHKIEPLTIKNYEYSFKHNSSALEIKYSINTWGTIDENDKVFDKEADAYENLLMIIRTELSTHTDVVRIEKAKVKVIQLNKKLEQLTKEGK